MRTIAKYTPTRFYGRSHIMYGLTQFICERPYITHGLPNMWQYSRIYGRPRYCVWSPMLLQWSLTIPLARPRWLVDAQQSLRMDTQEKFGASHVLLGNHELLMGTHTALCGCVCHARAHPCLYTQCGHGRVYVCARKYVGTHYARPRM